MEAQRDSRLIAALVAMDQLEALGAAAFDIGVKRLDGTMLLREGWSARQVLKSLLWLRRENLNCGHIYVRPAGLHRLSLVNDLKPGAIVRTFIDRADGRSRKAVAAQLLGDRLDLARRDPLYVHLRQRRYYARSER